MLSRSNSTANNSAQPARDYGSYDPNSYYGQIVPSGSHLSRTNTNSSAPFHEPRSFGRRASSFGSTRFPPQHRSPVQIIILDPPPQRGRSNHAWRGPPIRPAPDAASVEDSLRKEFYNPSTKRITNAVNLYYRDTPVNPRDVAHDGDGGKRCAVCLEDFERGQEVTLTPCNHMFHHDCIVPWAKTNPQCPVCRFDLGPKLREPPSSSSSSLPFNNSNYSGGGGGGGGGLAHMAGPGLTTQEFLSIVRALGDGFQL